MLPTDLLLNPEARLVFAGVCAALYSAVCLAVAGRERTRRNRLAALEPAATGSPSILIAFASQTGTAEELALHTAQRLSLAGVSAHVVPLDALTPEALHKCEQALFVVSTYGEGNAPDNAARFESLVMGQAASLSQLHCGVLALGDASYADYCGFGRRLDAWLLASGAQTLFTRIEVDRGDEAALNAWEQQMTHLAGSSDAPDWRAPAFEDWLLLDRRQLNPGSAGAPLFEIKLAPASGAMPTWESGDLAQLQVPGDTQRPRDYSIASLPQEGALQLLIRLHRDADGRTGLGSGWLTQGLKPGDRVPLRIRPHRLFRLGENAERPLILIGNGSGLAGLLGHLKARAAAQQHANWLIYGERNAASDMLYRAELDAWLGAGHLQRLDRVFSRDEEGCARYVQDVVRASREELRTWIANGASLYVCGSLEGMAAGVDQALLEIVGERQLYKLRLSGRYRRDVY